MTSLSCDGHRKQKYQSTAWWTMWCSSHTMHTGPKRLFPIRFHCKRSSITLRNDSFHHPNLIYRLIDKHWKRVAQFKCLLQVSIGLNWMLAARLAPWAPQCKSFEWFSSKKSVSFRVHAPMSSFHGKERGLQFQHAYPDFPELTREPQLRHTKPTAQRNKRLFCSSVTPNCDGTVSFLYVYMSDVRSAERRPGEKNTPLTTWRRFAARSGCGQFEEWRRL